MLCQSWNLCCYTHIFKSDSKHVKDCRTPSAGLFATLAFCDDTLRFNIKLAASYPLFDDHAE